MSVLVLDANERDLRRVVLAVNELGRGRSNATGEFTLATSATSTTVTAPNCAAGSVVLIAPKTANAAAALSTTFVSAVNNGSFTVTHASNAQTDRTFGYECRG
jgi:hypothetical protein